MPVTLVAAGSIVYHGPTDGVLDFFDSQGFQCPTDTGIADFLQEVTSRKDQQVLRSHACLAMHAPAAAACITCAAGWLLRQRLARPLCSGSQHACALLQQYWRGREAWQYVPVTKLVESCRASQVGRQQQADLAQPFQEQPRSSEALVTAPFALTCAPSPAPPAASDAALQQAGRRPMLLHSARGLRPAPRHTAMQSCSPTALLEATACLHGSFHADADGCRWLPAWQAFKACMRRECTLTIRNAFIYEFRTFQTAVLALISSTLFFRVHLHRTNEEANLYQGFLFFALLVMLFNGLSEMTFTVRLPPVLPCCCA